MSEWQLTIFRFPNGMIAVTDGQEQIPELQGPTERAIPAIIEWLKNAEKGGF